MTPPLVGVVADEERLLQLRLVGADRPGIVSEIAGVLADNAVSIVEIESATADAPMSGQPIFEASLALSVPPDLATEALQRDLEALANELMVDIDIDDTTTTDTETTVTETTDTETTDEVGAP